MSEMYKTNQTSMSQGDDADARVPSLLCGDAQIQTVSVTDDGL